MFRLMFSQAMPSSVPGDLQSARIDGSEADRLGEREHGGLGRGIVTGHEGVGLDAVDEGFGLARGERRVECLDHVCLGQSSLEPLGDGRPGLDRAIRDIDDDLARERVGQFAGQALERRIGDRQDDDAGRSSRLAVAGRHGGAGRCGDGLSVLGITRADDDVVPGARGGGGEGTADVAGPDDGDGGAHPWFSRAPWALFGGRGLTVC